MPEGKNARDVFRRSISSVAALVAGFGVAAFPWPGMFWTRAIPAALFVGSAALVHTKSLGANVLARALWVSTGVLAAVDLFAGPAAERGVSALLVGATTVAVLAAGRRGLDDEASPGPFRPVAFRAALLASMAMAVTDAHTLLFYGVAWLESRSAIMPPLVLGLLTLVSAFGLFRLKAWGLFATLAVNSVVLFAAVTGALLVPPQVAVLLGLTSFAQLLLPIPLLRAITRARPPEAEARARGSVDRLRFAPTPSEDAEVEADVEAESLDVAPAPAQRPATR